MASPDACFTPEAGGFLPSDNARSAWGPDQLHGGPAAGLLARAAEALLPDGLMPARITIDLFRPVPKQLLAVPAEVVRAGRRIHVVEASLVAGDVEVARATVLAVRAGGLDVPAQAFAHRDPPPPPEQITAAPLFAGMASAMPWRGFHTELEVRRVSGEPGSGRGVAWVRIPFPLVEGEEMSPFVHAVTMSDFANGLGNIRQNDGGPGFINADITVQLHRLPDGEWLGMEVAATADPEGIAVNFAACFDRRGTYGRVMQTLLANPRPAGASAPRAK
jgi:hypothetical protein